jgi:D-alanine-D-alanine ligase
MDEKLKITVLYDAAEDSEKAKAEKEGKPFPLAYAQVAAALEKRGHNVQTLGVERKIRNLVSLIEKDSSDVIFNLCEAIASSAQHEHNVVGLLELFQKCFTGSGSAGWLLTTDKALCKKILQFHGIRYPRFCVVEQGRVEWADDLEFPLIVKPLNEDASIGIDKGSVVHNVKDLLERISALQHQFDSGTLVEEYVEGREIYVGVIGNDRVEPFPIIEWDFSKVKDGPKIAGREAKWDRDSEGYKAPVIFPEDIPDEVVEGIQTAAITAFQALKLSGYARVDMRLRKRPKDLVEAQAADTTSDSQKDEAAVASQAAASHDKTPSQPGATSSAEPPQVDAPQSRPLSRPRVDPGSFVTVDSNIWDFPIIEVNPNCWLEKRGEFAAAARKHGLSYPELLEKIIGLALERKPRSEP